MYGCLLINFFKSVADSIVWVCRGRDLQTMEDATERGGTRVIFGKAKVNVLMLYYLLRHAYLAA